jgi:pimeloyl-ACP methyl ester carboxylesterase
MPPVVSIFLPGLHGTDQLFESFPAAAPSRRAVTCQPLPSDKPRGYAQLADWVAERLPPGRVALIAESYAGPLAVLVADRCPSVVAVVLSASFVESPVRLWIRPPACLWKLPPPRVLLRLLMTAGDRALAESLRRALRSVPSDVIAHRVESILDVDARNELKALSRPLLYLRATRDRLVGARSANLIRTLKPDTELADVDGPHMLLQANPSGAWSVIEPFLQRAEASAGG